MLLNKKGWHKFMSICLCIAVLCITNKQSASLGDWGRGDRQVMHRRKALGQGTSAQKKGPHVALGASPGHLCLCSHPLSFHPFCRHMPRALMLLFLTWNRAPL